MTEWEWVKLIIGIMLPILVGHGIWATATILRLRQIVEGSDGKNGLKSTVNDMDAWRYGKPPYDSEGRTLDVESRCRHEAKNIVQGVLGEHDLEQMRRQRPKRGG